MSTATTAEPIRAAIYTRISSDDTRDELGVRRQERNCRELAERHGWTVAEVYCDNDRSASKVGKDFAPLARPAFSRLLGDVRAGRVDVVLCQNQDRLSRLPDELEVVARTLRAAGHRSFWTASSGEQRIDSTNARLGYRVKGLFDTAYSEYISEKVREKKDDLAVQGLPAGGGSRPYGYEADKVTVRPDEADAIRRMAAAVLAGDSMLSICRDLNDRGVPTVTGALWRPKVVRDLLLSPRVAGLRQHRGEVVGDASWPAILDRAEWERVGAVLRARSRAPITRRRALLTGILRCGRCGHLLYRGANNGRPAYTCAKHLGGCARLAVAAEPLDALVAEMVLTAVDTPALAAVTTASDATGAAASVADLEARKVELAEAFAAGEINRAQLAAATRRLDDDLTAVRRILAVAPDPLAAYTGKPGLLRRRWPDLRDDERRAVVAAVVESVEVAPAARGRWTPLDERLSIRWRA